MQRRGRVGRFVYLCSQLGKGLGQVARFDIGDPASCQLLGQKFNTLANIAVAQRVELDAQYVIRTPIFFAQVHFDQIGTQDFIGHHDLEFRSNGSGLALPDQRFNVASYDLR